MKNKIEYQIILVGLIAGGISYWFNPYNRPLFGISIFTIMVISTFIGSFFLTILLIEKPYKIALLATLGVILAVIARIIFDGIMDPTSHNLAPFEIIICGSITIISTLVGAYFALLIKKFLFKKKIRKTPTS